MFINLLDQIGSEHIDSVGGKGANLGELVQLDLPVPPGFVVTTAGYRYFVAANGLQQRILDRAGEPNAADPAAYETASAHLYDLFTTATMPDDLADSLVYAGALVWLLAGQSVATPGAAPSQTSVCGHTRKGNDTKRSETSCHR